MRKIKKNAERIGTTNNNAKLLELRELRKVFIRGQGFSKTELVAVNDAALTLEQGRPEIFTLAGESGSGKSTVAKLILGFEQPTSGDVLYKGQKIEDIKGTMAFMKDVQPVFQNPFETFNPLKKIDSYLYETEKNFRMPGAKEHQPAREALELVGLSLEEIAGKYPSEMSGGQLQRASIARALITKPSLLIADEPVSMIDASLRMSVVNLFKKLKEQEAVSIVYITHDLATAYYVSDRIAIMLRGHIVEIGPTRDILGQPLHPYTQMLIDSVPAKDPKARWEEDITLSDMESKEFARKGCKFAGRCPKVMDICRNTDPANAAVGSRLVRCHLFNGDN